jgi:hypothetical protein
VSGHGDLVDDDDQHPQDLKGCLFFAFRFSGCLLYLYITMFIAIIAAAVLSLIFFR